MFHSKVSIDADNKTLNLYQAFIVFKTPIRYLSLVHNTDNKSKEEKRINKIFIRCGIPCALVFVLSCIQSIGTRGNFLNNVSNFSLHLLKLLYIIRCKIIAAFIITTSFSPQFSYFSLAAPCQFFWSTLPWFRLLS